MTARLMSHLVREAPALVALAVPFAAQAAFGRALPDPARAAAWTGVGLYLSLVVFPLVDPLRRVRWDAKPLPGLRLGVSVVTVAGALLTARALFDGDPEAAHRVTLLASVALLGVVGNALPALPPNLFVGIRLPWTVLDRAVWARTHRAAGRGLVALAVALAALWPLLRPHTFEAVMGGTVLLTLAGSIVHSWVLSRHTS